jgi:hypothetical protein
MAHVNHHFEPFVGGEEKTYHITHTDHEEGREEGEVIDLTGYSIAAEVWWEGCLRQYPIIGIVNLATGEPHYTMTLNEQQTMAVPLGRVAFVKLIRQSPDGVTTIRGPIWLNRKA